MNQSSPLTVVAAIITLILPVALVVDLIVYNRRPDWFHTWEFFYCPTFCLLAMVLALSDAIRGDWTFAIINTAFCAWLAWKWWNDDENNRRRRKWRLKLLARVVDAGGRLKVRPSGASD